MNITIVGSPHFHVGVDQATVKLLLDCSAAHYDGDCKAAGVPGGFLFGWNNLLVWADADAAANPGPGADRCRPTGTFRQIDLTLKICEVAHYLFMNEPDKLKVIHDYKMAICAALERANNIRDWRIEL